MPFAGMATINDVRDKQYKQYTTDIRVINSYKSLKKVQILTLNFDLDRLSKSKQVIHKSNQAFDRITSLKSVSNCM